MPNVFRAASWLDNWLAAYPWSASADDAGRALVREASALPRSSRVALHKEAVSRLPFLRAAPDDPFRWHKGSAAYELACYLYEEKLSYTEHDVCALLRSSKHDCGHGADVKPPLELAVKWARANGVTPAWLAAVRTFIEGLRGLQSVQANHLKTQGGLLLILDGDHSVSTQCHSERFRSGLVRLPRAERVAWERLVLWMGTTMGARLPKGYDVQASALAAFLGVHQVLARLGEWLPEPGGDRPCKVETAGSHLFKNLVWLLLVIASDEAPASFCDVLVDRLVHVDFTPGQRGKKVAQACAVYFSRRPIAVGQKPLETLLARTMMMEKGSYDSDGIRKIVEGYLSRAS